MPLLVQDALLHLQFETIHPFVDGNGRLGRMVLVLFLIIRGRLTAPLLYLSAGIERQRDRYYAALRVTRTDGELEASVDRVLTHTAVMRTRTRIEAIDDVAICRVDVAPSSRPVTARMSDKSEKFWVRMNNSTRALPEIEIEDYCRDHW